MTLSKSQQLFVGACVLLLMLFGVYDRGGAFPLRSDHYYYLYHQSLAPDLWSWLETSLFYNQTSALRPGDGLLQRPFLWLYQALCAYFLRGQPNDFALAAVVPQAVAGLVILGCLARVVSPLWSTALVCWAVVAPGSWQAVRGLHISPYLFAVAAFVLGHALLEKASQQRPLRSLWFWATAGCFLTAAFFHEITLVALGLYVTCIWLPQLLWPLESNIASRQRAMRVCVLALVVAAAYVCWFVVAWLLYPPHDLLFAEPTAPQTIWTHIHAWVITSASFGPVLFRALSGLKIAARVPEGLWGIFLGTTFLLLLFGFTLRLLRTYRTKDDGLRRARDLAVIALLFLGVLLLAVGSGRVTLRGPSYLKYCKYYHSMILLIATLPLATCIACAEASKNRFAPRLVRFAFVFLTGLTIAFAMRQIGHLRTNHVEQRVSRVQLADSVERLGDLSPTAYVAGVVPVDFSAPPTLYGLAVWDESRELFAELALDAVKPATTPVYLRRSARGYERLVRLANTEYQGVSIEDAGFRPDRFPTPGELFYNPDWPMEWTPGMPILLRQAGSAHRVDVSLRLHTPHTLGVFFHFGSQLFYGFVFDRCRANFVLVSPGNKQPCGFEIQAYFPGWVPPYGGEMTVEIRHCGDILVAFVNGYLASYFSISQAERYLGRQFPTTPPNLALISIGPGGADRLQSIRDVQIGPAAVSNAADLFAPYHSE